jgi:hypothetical protein
VTALLEELVEFALGDEGGEDVEVVEQVGELVEAQLPLPQRVVQEDAIELLLDLVEDVER